MCNTTQLRRTAVATAKDKAVEDAPGPRAHEDTWGANPEAKKQYEKANPPAKADTEETKR